MDTYITGATIKTLREKRGITQTQLADVLGVSGKAISKWETARGLPDITLIEPLAKALGVSVMELMSGDTIINKNISPHTLRHTFATRCQTCGVPQEIVGRWLGHKSTTITDAVYTHYSTEFILEQAKKVVY